MNRYRINQIRTNIDVPMGELPAAVAGKAGISVSDISWWEVRRKSVDSRKKPDIKFVYTIDFETDRILAAENLEDYVRNRGSKGRRAKPVKGLLLIDKDADKVIPPQPGTEVLTGRPVVVGTGPCGLFAGLELARLGYRPIIIERGPAMEGRIHAVEKFRQDRVLDPEANMLFGEGGAGTFSDGKIGTGIKDGLIRRVLTEFRDAGAGEDIMYLARPHIGTDVLRPVIVNIRNKIIELGGEVRFNTRLESLIIEDRGLTGIRIICREDTHISDSGGMQLQTTRKINTYSDNTYGNPTDNEHNRSNGVMMDDALHGNNLYETITTNALILAIGHSARDTFAMINDSGIVMQQKPFSIGVRMEHPQSMIDVSQYGEENAGKLPPADYRLAYKAANGRGVYSFCMCPGGEVVVCSNREGELCVNGMSNRMRDSGTANSGILCDVRTEDFGSDDVLAGVRFQERYERLAFGNGGGRFTPPRCRMEDFLSGNAKAVINSLPDFAAEAIREAVPDFARKIHGYDDPDAVVTAVETRSSSPVRIVRDESGQSNIRGIYPAGEGAGYAGGITSAACDGIRAAWHVVQRFSRN